MQRWNCVWKDTNSKINAMESVYQIKRPQICQPVCFCSPSLSGSVASPSPIMHSLWLCKENGCLLRKYISAGISTAGGRVERGENLRQPSAAQESKWEDVVQTYYNVWCILTWIFTVEYLTDGAMSDCLHEWWIASLLLILQSSFTATHYSNKECTLFLSKAFSYQSCKNLKAKFTHYPVTTAGGVEEEEKWF